MNKWTNGKQIITSETRPNSDFYAVISEKRVNKRQGTYRPYESGSAEWRKDANRQLADTARTAFELR